MGDIFIVCLKYTPANWQHMDSFASCLEKQGQKARFVLSEQFRWMNEKYASQSDYLSSSRSFFDMLKDTVLFFLYKWYFFVRIVKKNKPRLVLFVMWHPLNVILAKIVKNLYPQCHACTWMHEPYKLDKSEYRNKIIAFKIIEYLQELLLKYLDTVILHSRLAFEGFNIRYPSYRGKTKIIPLLFRDTFVKELPCPRVFDFTFIGFAVKPKGIDTFFAIVKKNMELNLGLKFQIVTSSNIKKYLRKLDKNWGNCLEVFSENNIGDNEIRRAYSRSYIVSALYKDTTQSAVVPLAFMHATPVLATDIAGLRECVKDKVNGVILQKNFTEENVIQAIRYIKENFSDLSKNARASFEETWSDKNFTKYYSWVAEI